MNVHPGYYYAYTETVCDNPNERRMVLSGQFKSLAECNKYLWDHVIRIGEAQGAKPPSAMANLFDYADEIGAQIFQCTGPGWVEDGERDVPSITIYGDWKCLRTVL